MSDHGVMWGGWGAWCEPTSKDVAPAPLWYEVRKGQPWEMPEETARELARRINATGRYRAEARRFSAKSPSLGFYERHARQAGVPEPRATVMAICGFLRGRHEKCLAAEIEKRWGT